MAGAVGEIARWLDLGLFDASLRAAARQRRRTMGQRPELRLGIIDTQTVTYIAVRLPRDGVRPRASRRLDPEDAGNKVTGHKRHIPVNTLDLLLSASVHPANVRCCSGALPKETRRAFPLIEQRSFADGGYQGPVTVAAMRAVGRWRLKVVKHPDGVRGFAVLPRRRVVERTFVWLTGCRRLAKDFKTLAQTALTFLHLALIRLMLR